MIGSTGKTLGLGGSIAREHGLQPGGYVHVFAKPGALALQILPEYEHGAYKLVQEGRGKKGVNTKVVFTIQKLVRRGLVRPGQRFNVRPHESGKILFLDPAD